MNKIISNCPLCETHALHIFGDDADTQMQQCIHCGYVSSPKFMGTKEDNEEYKKLEPDMKSWTKENNGRIWIPTILTLPIGMLYPINIDNMVNHKTEMKWAFAPMVEITDDEKEKYPNGNGGFYEKRIDTENSTIYDTFVDGMFFINKTMKNNGQ